MKRWTRLISFFLAAVMLLTMPAFATVEATPKASSYIMRTCVYLEHSSGSQFNIWYEVIALGIMDELGAWEIQVQESTDGSSWTTVKTYTPSEEPSMVIEDDIGHSSYVTYTGLSGRYYRAYVMLFAENSSGIGFVSDYTETLYLVYNLAGGR